MPRLLPKAFLIFNLAPLFLIDIFHYTHIPRKKQYRPKMIYEYLILPVFG
jgi:hypothetical protein